MDLEWSATDSAFRDEVRGFLEEKLTPELRRAGRLMTSVYAEHEASMEWQRVLHERGWAAPAWPVAYGGCDWSLTQHYIFSRESTLAGAPSLSPMGIRMVAHAIIAYGTEAQREYFLPRILTGEVVFCQGYSEPEAGSDLAALSMAAVDDGDDLVCTGSKIWTTHASEANWMFGLVRTSRTPKKQQGITFVLIDMTSPGIQIRPLVMTSGEKIQNQVFFDDVRVPKSNVLGTIDDGWTVAKYLLEFERGGGAAAPALQVMAEEIATVSADQPGPGGGRLLDDPAFVRKLADARIRTEVLEILEYRVLAAAEPTSGEHWQDVSTVSERDGDGSVVRGTKIVALSAPLATHLLITARTSGTGADGISLFLVEVDSGAPGIEMHNYRTVDDRRASDLVLDGLRVPGDGLLGDEGQAWPSIAQARDEGAAAICSEAVGSMRKVLADTVEYCKQRRQFGQPIGSFQVLQHRLVDMYMELEQAVAAVYLAVLNLEAGAATRARAVSAAKATVGRAARFVGQQAVQLHGGMGMTEELAIGHYFKRLTAIQYEFGSTDYHVARYAELTRA